ncbi:zinc-binding dehydrogenase [Vibrio cyclitrophicus]|uniref:zinc-binding dehydrogenase n=1 Tax=Vibrio cyclitrophicus TaxID=47951 RepID=UPI000C842286|nr:zinc-binding dehydrogenase [Vibrio cyclitrophicus]PMH40936.1 dehydrogenase [Vibrio cyclitrophicus]PMH77432.1 dehydrogenase [Vibrio cyclitrophicus]
MKAITYQKTTDTFILKTLPKPSIENEFDVIVKVFAAGLNPVDGKINNWASLVDNMDDNFVGGLDVSGEIVEVGAEVSNWEVGDQVLYHGDMRRHSGGFSEFSVHDSRTLIRKPNVSHEIAAATPCAAWTAYRALHDKINIIGCESLFIAGGAGGVGSFAIQLAKIAGVKSIITTSSEAKHSYVKSLGATHVIDYRTQNVIEEVMKVTSGLGVDFALDCVGGNNAYICSQVLGFEGEMVELVDVVNPTLYPGAKMNGLSFHQISLGSGHINGDKGRKTIVTAGITFSQLLESKLIVVPELKVISLEDVPSSLNDIRKKKTLGKIVVQVAEH